MKTEVSEAFNFCDPNDWPEQGQCCGLSDCHECPPVNELDIPDHLGRTPRQIHEAEQWVDDRHLRDNYYNEI